MNMKNTVIVLLFLLFSYTEAGAQWAKVLDYSNYSSVFSDNGGGLLFVCAAGGVYRSSNNGVNWSFCNPGISSGTIMYSVAARDSLVFACTGTDIYKSTNYGTNWVRVLQGYSNLGIVLFSGNNIFCNSKTAVMRSTNYGANWNYVISGLSTNMNLTFLAGSAGRLYTAGLTSNGVYVTTNNGENWTKTGTEIPPSIGIYSLYSKDNLVMAGSDNGVYISTNYGTNWRLIQGILAPFGLYGFASYGTNTLFISGWGSGVYASTNTGTNWIFWNDGMTNSLCNGMYYYNNYIFCGTIYAAFRRPVTDVGIRKIAGSLPEKFNLYQNFPNPFNPFTKIRFSVPGKSELVHLIIYDIAGRLIAEPVNAKLNAGVYEITFDGSGLESGTYFCMLRSGKYSESKKIILLK